MSERTLTDAQRRALDLSTNLVVTAGAGTGKTTVLVERYLRTLEELEASPSEVLAITFTNKAAAEMRGRVLAALPRRGLPPGREDAIRHGLAGAPISTIHAFCGSMLREFAVAAGVDPSFEVLEATERKLLLRETIDDLIRARAASPEGTFPDLDLLAGHLSRRELAAALEDLAGRGALAGRWAADLLAASDDALIARWSAGGPGIERALDPAADGDRGAARALASVQAGARLALPDDDALALRLRAVAALAAASPPPDRGALLGSGLLRADGKARSFGNVGSRRAWGPALEGTLAGYREALGIVAERVAEACRAAVCDLDRAALAPLRALARTWLDLDARFRARKDARSQLDFDDLLGRAAALLRDPARPAVRDALRGRFRAILVDEFQDVDPTQWEVIEALATDDRGALLPRRLFAVGDEKQSIYRFRGADVSIFGRLRGRAPEVALDRSFRSLPALVRFANGVFDRAFAPGAAPGAPLHEARPGPLEPEREDGAGAVEVVVAGPDDDEAELCARAARREIEGGRPAADVAILLRRRTNLKLFEEALRRHGVPFVVYGGIGFYAAPEVVDAANLLAFLADEREDPALAGVLRSPLGGLSDGGLYLVARAGGPGDTLFARLLRAAGAPEGLGLDPEDAAAARRAAALLSRLRAEAARRPAAELCREAFEASGAAVALALGPRGGQASANLRKLGELLRGFEARGQGGVARLAETLGALIDANEVEGEADVAAPGEGVRLLTVHGAKGLEFPVAIIPECGARANEEHPPVLLEESADGRPEIGLRIADPHRGFQRSSTGLRARLEEIARLRADAESRRLFYVACTRAADRLILIGSEPSASPSWLRLVSDAPRSPLPASVPAPSPAPAPAPVPAPVPVSVPLAPAPASASVLAPPLDPGPSVLRGLAVHRLLEQGAGPREPGLRARVARALAEAGAVEPDRAAAEVLADVRAALAAVARSPLAVEIAAADEVWRERPFALARDDGSVVEGRIDLLFRRGARWRVVDWKTDDLLPLEVHGAAAERGYERQLALYAEAAMRILGLDAIDATLYFTAPGIALERRFERAAGGGGAAVAVPSGSASRARRPFSVDRAPAER